MDNYLLLKNGGTHGTSGTPLQLLGCRRSTIKINGGTGGTIKGSSDHNLSVKI